MVLSPISQRRITSILILVTMYTLVLNVHSSYTKDCHYSCLYCGSPHYSHCIICEESFTLTPIKNADNIKQYYNTLEEQPWGPCMGTLPETNTLGIILVIICIISLIYFRHRTIFYLTSSLQSLALFSLIQTGYTYPISYTLQSLEYFMFVSSLNRQNSSQKLQFFDEERFRMWGFLNSDTAGGNLRVVFVLATVVVGVVVVVPLARRFAKREDSLWSVCNCIKLQKIFTYLEISSLLTFFFLIQQSILTISIGLFLDDTFSKSTSNIVMVAIYFIMLAFIIVNLCMKNLDLFSNKIGQQIQILKKTVAPLFIILPVNAIIAVAAFMLVLSLVAVIVAQKESKSKKRTYFHQKLIKREVIYRIVELVIIVLIIGYYLVEKYVQKYKASLAIGILTVIAIAIFLLCFLIEILIELFGKFIIKQSQQLYQNGGFQLSSLRQTKILEETIENFQTTDQGIMDMIFFGRNRQQDTQNTKQQKRPKKTNIHLTMDQLNESTTNNQQQEKLQGFTPSVSPNNRQLERMLKSKASRTPKNDRASRFKLNKAFETERSQQNGIQKVQEAKISIGEQQKFQQKNDTIEVDYKRQDTTEISQIVSSNLPKTTKPSLQSQQPIRIVPEQSLQQEKSPRHDNKPQHQQQHGLVTTMTDKPSTKGHILNIFLSEEQEQDQLDELQLNQNQQKERQVSTEGK